MRPTRREHWNEVYRTKTPESVSWYQSLPDASLRALDMSRVPMTASLVDVGGGVSSLVDSLIERGWSDLTVVDIAASALEAAKARLGVFADQICWEVADLTDWQPRRAYDVWHDRAVFHFLTDAEQRKAYRRALGAGTAEGALIVLATFAPDGPERCSGLPVRRYDARELAAELGPEYALQDDWREEHVTPAEGRQSFQWCIFRRAQSKG